LLQFSAMQMIPFLLPGGPLHILGMQILAQLLAIPLRLLQQPYSLLQRSLGPGTLLFGLLAGKRIQL